MNILGFNPYHHSSVCLLQDGELKYFIQEERLTKKKYDSHPFKSFIELLQNYKIDWTVWGTPSVFFPTSSNSPSKEVNYWVYLAFKYHSNIKFYDFSNRLHHLCHISHSFYNSGFKNAIGVVIDGLGSGIFNENNPLLSIQETETIFYCSYPSNFKVLYKNFVKGKSINLSQIYEAITMHLGWSRNEAGKTMGLAPYGKYNSSLPNFLKGNKGNLDVFYKDYFKKTSNPAHTESFINEENNPQLKLQRDPKEWHHDESKITDLEKDLAWKVQNETQQLVGDYIEKAVKETGLKQVCCAGGYFLNCVTNYYLLKRFPDIEFYFEPIANDSGTAVGAAKLLWHTQTQDTTIRPFKSLYLGKQYSQEELLEGIKKYVDN